MAATPSVKITKTFTYRGVSRRFSNRYHLAGGTPPDTAHWIALMDSIVAFEAAIYASSVQIVAGTAYAAGSEVPVASKTYSTNGSGTFTSAQSNPGDVAALVRYATAARSSKNHPVYLFNYYHGAWSVSGNADVINVNQKSAMSLYAGRWISPGFSDGTTSYTRAGPNGAAATGAIVEDFLTHRDLPR